MERSWTPSLAPPSGPDLTRQRARVREALQTQIEKGREIERRSIKTTEDRLAQISDAANWTEYNMSIFDIYFNTIVSRDYRSATPTFQTTRDEYERFDDQQLLASIGRQMLKLESVLDEVDLLTESVAQTTTASGAAESPDRSKVFVVHGHDEGALQAVARFLEKIGLDAVVLREQADQGHTIIEKFEACASEVGFAVALLTPDDLGGP
jgi:hypothetical protein